MFLGLWVKAASFYDDDTSHYACLCTLVIYSYEVFLLIFTYLK